MRCAWQQSWKRVALASLLCAQLCACSPDAFDDLVKDTSARGDGGIARRKDAGPRSPGGDGGADAAQSGGTGGSDSSARAGAGAGGVGVRDSGPERDGSVVVIADAALDGGDSGGATVDAGDAGCPHVVDPANVGVTTSEVGIMPVPSWVSSRAVFGSAAVGERVLWIFSVPGDRNMAAWSGVDEPLRSPPQLNEAEPFVSLLPASANPSTNPITVTGLVGTSDDEALLIYTSTFYLQPQAVGLARLQRDQLLADVVRPLDLYPAPEPPPAQTPWRPLYNMAPVLVDSNDGPLLYLYACQANPNKPEETTPGLLSQPCRVARVALADVGHHMAFRHWSGSDWVEDPTQAVVVMSGVTGGLTVSFNRYLGEYVAVHSGAGDNVLLRAAPSPEGPWRTLGGFGTLPGGGPLGVSLGGAEHAALKDPCERVLYITYTRVLETMDENGTKISRSETRLIRVKLD